MQKKNMKHKTISTKNRIIEDLGKQGPSPQGDVPPWHMARDIV